MKAKNVPGLRWTEFFQNENIYMFSVFSKNGKYIFLHPMVMIASIILAWYCKCLHTVQHDMIMILDLTCNQALHYLTKYHQAWTKHFYDVLMMMMMLMVMISEWSVATSAISLCSSELFYLHFLFRCFQHSWRLSLNNWTWLDNSMCSKQSSVVCTVLFMLQFCFQWDKRYRISEKWIP